MDRELLIEIGTEEIPASWLPALTTAFGAALEASLKASRLTADAPVETFSTPRRLTARFARVSERQADREEVITGPPVGAAFDTAGQPTPAAEGFARKQGVDVAARDRLRAKLEKVLAEDFPSAVGRVYPLELGPPVGWPVQYRVSGPDLGKVREIALELARIVAGNHCQGHDWQHAAAAASEPQISGRPAQQSATRKPSRSRIPS